MLQRGQMPYKMLNVLLCSPSPSTRFTYLENVPENQHKHTSHQNQQDAEGKDICIEDVIRIASKTDERGEPGYNEATVQVNK
jgi:hypothetical protein